MWLPETAALLQGKTVGPLSLSSQPASPGAAAVWTPAFPLVHAPARVEEAPLRWSLLGSEGRSAVISRQ